MKKISLACDHGGFLLKEEVLSLLKELDYEVIDHGCHSFDSVDYPDYAQNVAQDIQNNKAPVGILICGSGIGMAITANKFKGIRAAALTDVYSTEMTRKHNDLNILCLGARVVGSGLAKKIIQTFLQTEFEGDRHTRRLNKIKKIEGSL